MVQYLGVGSRSFEDRLLTREKGRIVTVQFCGVDITDSVSSANPAIGPETSSKKLHKNAVHDINNVLTVIMGNLQMLLLNHASDLTLSKELHTMDRLCSLVSMLVKDLDDTFIREGRSDGIVNINDIVTLAETLACCYRPERSITFELSLADRP
jgi:nitrogen-specific signal transduction histidine kinase